MKSSIFLKLLGILVVTAITVNLLVYAGFRFFLNNDPLSKEILETFQQANLENLAEEIGFPPDPARMKEVAERTRAEIRIESGSQVWQTSDDLPKLRDHGRVGPFRDFAREAPPRPHRPPPVPQFLDFFGHSPPRLMLVVSFQEARYGFFPPDIRNFAGRYQRFLFPFLLLLTFMIGSSFFAIRIVLSPLRSLLKGVNAIAEGQWEHKVSVRGRDEFSELASSFNRMVATIKETLEAKERLLLDVSHELQSPLARMKMAIELMHEEKAKERLKTNLRDIETMVAEILESARLDSSPGSLQLRKTDLRKNLEDFLEVYRMMDAPVHLHAEPGPLFAEVDAARFVIVMRNLLDNALKHADARDKRVDISLQEEGENFRIEVKDNGLGIPAEDIPHLFDPFYRVDKSRNRQTGGYGLGLSLCKRIVDAHGGTIEISSASDGTRLSLLWPKSAKR